MALSMRRNLPTGKGQIGLRGSKAETRKHKRQCFVTAADRISSYSLHQGSKVTCYQRGIVRGALKIPGRRGLAATPVNCRILKILATSMYPPCSRRLFCHFFFKYKYICLHVNEDQKLNERAGAPSAK